MSIQRMQKSGDCVQRSGCVKSSPPSDPERYDPNSNATAKDGRSSTGPKPNVLARVQRSAA
jgi:hypothetical protein